MNVHVFFFCYVVLILEITCLMQGLSEERRICVFNYASLTVAFDKA